MKEPGPVVFVPKSILMPELPKIQAISGFLPKRYRKTFRPSRIKRFCPAPDGQIDAEIHPKMADFPMIFRVQCASAEARKCLVEEGFGDLAVARHPDLGVSLVRFYEQSTSLLTVTQGVATRERHCLEPTNLRLFEKVGGKIRPAASRSENDLRRLSIHAPLPLPYPRPYG
jgi:hypothetical protein